MPETTSFENFHIEIGRRIDDDVYARVVKLALLLTQEIRRVYVAELITSTATGATNGILYEVERANGTVSMVLGVSKAAEHLLFLEFGERGTENAGKGFVDIGINTRRKAPPLKSIRDWIRLSGMPISKATFDRAKDHRERKEKNPNFDTDLPWYSDDPLTLAAYYIAQARKKHGRRAMRIFERVMTAQRSVIQQYLSGA